MPSWGNTDSLTDKPHFPQERQVRPFATLTTYSTTASGNTIIFVGSGATTPANVGIVAGMSAYATNLSTTGEQEFFVSNNVVRSVSGNTITLSNNVFGSIASGTTVDIPVHRNLLTEVVSPINAVIGEYGTTISMGGNTYTGITFPVILRDYPTYTLVPITNDSFINWSGSFKAFESVL